MIDLHTHTLLSDGILIPSELARRAEENGYTVLGITDHIDFSNFESIISSTLKVAESINKSMKIQVIPGAEITHVHPVKIPQLVSLARKAGAKLVIVHGETVVEPVLKGTNRAALEAGVDILAHPGILTEEDAKLAAEKKIPLEISARHGHCLSNGHIVRLWYKYGFPIVLNTDTHSPENLIDDNFARTLIISAGIQEPDVKRVLDNTSAIVERLLK
ncbi:MAG: histidinol phosphate phosphatase domain-containing protein [Candidatus Omnitrophica bacterium]|nr:histidinol phosphate phosphatase domain-containing protein [Candidatus Omnitrophota bacterium]MCM8777206.1 histidinol phosphate phosphatase domain-containing protein [Candidatus Omnitrophota bacterium]